MNLDSYLFKAWSKFIFFFINILAIYLFFKGHNEPGGGFIAGIASGISIIFLYMALGKTKINQILTIDASIIALVGLLIAFITAIAPICFGYPFLYHKMIHLHLPLMGDLHVGTPLFFDLGVYFVVVGISAKIAIMFDLYKEAQ